MYQTFTIEEQVFKSAGDFIVPSPVKRIKGVSHSPKLFYTFFIPFFLTSFLHGCNRHFRGYQDEPISRLLKFERCHFQETRAILEDWLDAISRACPLISSN